MAVKASIENALEKNNITKPIGKILRLIPPFAYLGVNFHERIVRNYDHYSATYNYFQTIDEVIDWFKTAGFDNLESVSVPVSIRGIKISSKENPQKSLSVKYYPIIDHFKFRKEWEQLYSSEKNKNKTR